MAPGIKKREGELAKLDVLLRQSRASRPSPEKLRADLASRQALWRSEIREEPKYARTILERLITPITLTVEPEEPTWVETPGALPGPDYHRAPQFRSKYDGSWKVAWEASVKAEGLLDGFAHHSILAETRKIGGTLSRA